MEVFQDYAYYYNLFYGDKDYALESKTIVKILDQYGKQYNNDKRILDIGCGTGRHDAELNKFGYKIHGIDLSSDMINIAKINAPNEKDFFYEVQDARNFAVMYPYDYVISLFHVMSYQNTNTDLSRTFKCVRESLTSGGVFVFDAWYGPGVLSEKPSVRVKRVEDPDNLFVRIAEPVMYPNENIVEVKYDVSIINKHDGKLKKINETHKMRYFFKPEIEELLRKNGLKLIDCLDCSTLKIPDFNSWTVYFVAKK